MKIGLDIDGVIYDTENAFRCQAELYDLLELHKKGTVNNEFWAQYRYDWTEEQQEEFKSKYFLKLSKDANLIVGAKETIELLKKDGHELIIITARGNWIKENEYLKEVNNWGEIYRYIYNLKMEEA